MPLTLPTLGVDALSLAPPSLSEREFETPSPSPYPPSSSFSDSSEDDNDLPLPINGLRTSVAALPENKLRSIMVKLADSNPRFHRAIMKELACAQEFVGGSPPTTPTNTKQRRRRRGKTQSQRNCKNLSVTTDDPFAHHGHITPSDEQSTEDFVYHPGHLDKEVYEFLSRTPEEVAFKFVRTITMWSCCDEDEWSPGCVSAPSFANHADHERDEAAIMEFSHPGVFPDSDLEQRYEDVLRNTIARSAVAGI